MNFVVVGLKNNYHIKRLQEEAEKRGHKVYGILPSQLVIRVDPDKGVKYIVRGCKVKFSEIDVIYPWAISTKRKWDWFLFFEYLHKKYKTQFVYSKYVDPCYKYSLTSLTDYIKQVENNILFPKSVIFFNHKSIRRVLKALKFPMILKVSAPRMSSQGRGVFLVNSKEELEKVVTEYESVANRFTAREFIPNNGDIRVFVVGYKAVAAMHRIPKEGDFRSNISQGGGAEAVDLRENPELVLLAEKISKILKTDIAGVDIMIHKYTQKPYLLEINPGPQFQGLESLTGQNIAKELILYFEKLGAKRKKKGFFGF